MSNIENFKELYNFEFEEIKDTDMYYRDIEKKYLASYKEGKEKGFTPVFLVLYNTLLEKFEIDMEDEDTDNIMDIVKSNLEKYKDLDSLVSANIAAQKGTVPESMVKEQLPKAQLTSLTNMGEAVNELQSGKVDAVHMDEPVALSYATKNADLAVATVSLTMKEGEENAVAIKKGNSDLKEVVDKVIQKLKDDGTYQTYLEKAAKLTEVEQ